jgi:hypothetical protein
MSDIQQARAALTKRILEGAGNASSSERRAAFNNSGLAEPVSTLVDKVARHAYRVTDEDIHAVRMSAAKASGLSEDQIFEIVVCAAIGQAPGSTTRRLRPLMLLMPPSRPARSNHAASNPR